MFRSNKLVSMIVFLCITVLLTACGGKPTTDPNQKMTEIAATVQAELTQAAASNPTATPTPEPTATPTPSPITPTQVSAVSSPVVVNVPTQPQSSTADNAVFISDVSFPDGSVVKPGEQFVKTWRLQNNGKTTWTKDYAILYLEGVLYGKDNQLLFKLPVEVKPGESVDISVPFTAPTAPGSYGSYWKLYNSSGFVFGDAFSVNITVGEPTATGKAPTVTLTATNTPNTTGTVAATATTDWGTGVAPSATP